MGGRVLHLLAALGLLSIQTAPHTPILLWVHQGKYLNPREGVPPRGLMLQPPGQTTGRKTLESFPLLTSRMTFFWGQQAPLLQGLPLPMLGGLGLQRRVFQED